VGWIAWTSAAGTATVTDSWVGDGGGAAAERLSGNEDGFGSHTRNAGVDMYVVCV